MSKVKDKSAEQKPTSARLLKLRPVDPRTDDVEVRPRNLIAEAAKELSPEELTGPKQSALLVPVEEAKRPQPVQNGRLLATYVGLGLERGKDGEKLVHLDFSFPLGDAHNGHIPRRVKQAWEWMILSGNPYVRVGGIPHDTVDIFLDPKEKKPLLHYVGAEYSKAVISVVEETGKGKSKQVTRFAFRLLVERDEKVMDFAAWHDGEEFWLRLEPTQRDLI